ncbi:hypothetical protein M3148_02665 [Georgenia satyanarayanai]|uniref:VOC family protein n=1 Tax=Georgenia satyanarayanai TaxID=860221 RepID=UPI00204057CA|nr:VOC family protein [Georgenia satyanarayanai]MCM3659903.1 hypothetical protein [Georgenia satyanarayanai]
MRKSMFVSILAAAVMSASTLPAATATTEAATPPTDVILSGSVSGPDVASNVPVRLFILQPETEVSQAQTTGPAVKADRAATVHTDHAGRFSVPQSAVSPAALPTQSSRVDVAIIAGEPDGALSVFETTMSRPSSPSPPPTSTTPRPLTWFPNVYPSRRGPLLELWPEPAPKGDAKNRIHLDVRLEPGDDVDAVAAGIIARGGRELGPGWGDLPWRVYADPSGNELCVLPAVT